MVALLYIPIVLSLAVLGAHFLRYGNDFGVAAVLILIGVLFIRRAWAARLIQAALVLGAIEWVHTLVQLAKIRAMQGAPATRMIVILGSVAVVTLCSVLLFETRRLRKIYRSRPEA